MPHLDGLRKFVFAEPVRASPPRLALLLKTLADTTINAPLPIPAGNGMVGAITTRKMSQIRQMIGHATSLDHSVNTTSTSATT